jgi:Na+/glutamate symporter
MELIGVDVEALRQGAREAGAGLNAAASAAMVNRTHRVVHERAKIIQARRTKFRSLWIPLAVSGGLLAVIVCAIWTILDEYELAPDGLPDANQQLLVLMMWCLPVSAILLAIVWFRRGSSKTDNGSAG